MRKDMAKVVTERPRSGHANASRKWGWRLRQHEYDLDDHGPAYASSARHRQYGFNCKQFSDLLGPLRRYLRKQTGRPWDAVWSEITQTLDSRSLAGQHIFDHIRWDVTRNAEIDDRGRVCFRKWYRELTPVWGFYVHPVTGLLLYEQRPRFGSWDPRLRPPQDALRAFGIDAVTAADVRRYRVDGARVWERRDAGWFIHTYRMVPAQVVRVITRSDGTEVPIYAQPRRERTATKQAGKKEIRCAATLLASDPLED